MGERATSKDSSTRESVVLTPCPPGPEERENRHVSSLSGGWYTLSPPKSALLQPLGDQVHHRRVGERGDVADLAVLGDVAQQPAHDLARPGLGQLLDDHDLARLGDRADLLGHVVAQRLDRLLALGLVVGGAAAQDDERDDALAGGLVRRADDRGLGHRRVADQRGLHLGGRDAVPGDVHDVVDAAEQPHRAVVVVLGAVAREVVALLLEARPVRVAVALLVAPDAAQHRRPRLVQHQVAAPARADRLGLLGDHLGADPRQRAHRRTRLASR